MRSDSSPLFLKIATLACVAFLHVPLLLIFLYAFTTEEKTFQFPPPGYTAKWFGIVWERQDIWDAIGLSVKVAGIATFLALILGTCAAAAVSRAKFFGRDHISLLFILPIALPRHRHRYCAPLHLRHHGHSLFNLDYCSGPHNVLHGRSL